MAKHHLPGLEPGKEKLENKREWVFKIPLRVLCSFQLPLGCLERGFSRPAHSKLLLTSPGIILCYHLAPHVLQPAQKEHPNTLRLQDIPGISHPFYPHHPLHPPCERTSVSTPTLQMRGITKPRGSSLRNTSFLKEKGREKNKILYLEALQEQTSSTF